MMRQRLARLFLAAALVVAQHGVYAHALSHLDEARYGYDGGTPTKHAPEVCVAFVAASGAAPATSDLPLHVNAASNGAVASAPADPFLPPLALTRFASRAPPLPA
jgi:hypothetical protein